MDAATLNNYMAFADSMVTEAGKVMAEGFYGEKKVESKGGRIWDLVTDYDKKVEELLTSKINSTYPTHKVLAEEDSAAKGVKREELSEEPTWIIDPVDGTFNYVRGLPFSCISVGLAIGREVVVGIVYNPMSNEKYTAVKGQGAFLNGLPIHVRDTKGLHESVVSFEISFVRFPGFGEMLQRRYLAVTHKVIGVRNIGSAALTLCMIARGGIDAFIHEHLHSWDIAAGALILQEAGGYLCNIDGSELDLVRGNVLATANKTVSDELLQTFNENK